MNDPTRGKYSVIDVDGFDRLRDHIHAMYRMSYDRRVTALADILMNGYTGKSGYMPMGNTKVSKNTGIVNMNSATDCPNAASTEVDQSKAGACQVPWAICYAHNTENIYDATLAKRRLSSYLWDAFSANLWADAILQVSDRKQSEFNYIRISEAGDFRHNGDIKKWNTISKKVYPEVQVYTYSASHKLDWNEYATHEYFVVNQSNDLADYGDRQFTATYTDSEGNEKPIKEPSDVPEEAILCPFEAAKHNGIDTEDRPHCGECTHCIKPESEQPRDVAIIQH
jgi:hypothetical protein